METLAEDMELSSKSPTDIRSDSSSLVSNTESDMELSTKNSPEMKYEGCSNVNALGAGYANYEEWTDLKFHLPRLFDESCTLRNNDVHGIDTAGQLIKSIKFSAAVWLDKMTAYAMLSNGELFCTWVRDDICKREHGAVYLIKTKEYQDIDAGRMFCKDPHDYTKETMIGFYRIGNAESISVYEMSGDLWIRHRSVLSSASHFSLIQWRSLAKPDMGAKSIVPSFAAVASECAYIASQLANLTVEAIALEKKVHPTVTDDALWVEIQAVHENLEAMESMMTSVQNAMQQVKDYHCETTDIGLVLGESTT